MNMKEMSEAWDLIDFEAIKSTSFRPVNWVEPYLTIFSDQSALVSNCDHDFLTECFDGSSCLI
jgi:hypothetical protein